MIAEHAGFVKYAGAVMATSPARQPFRVMPISGLPSMIHAGTYSATLSYLKAVKAANTKDSDAVAAKLKELPVEDSFAKGKVLANGRFVHDLYLFEVKKPEESKKPWDYYKQVAVVPGDQAFPTAKDSGCPLTK